MNKLVHYMKIGIFACILTILLTACSKEEEQPTGPTKEFTCDHISLRVNNLLSGNLDSLVIGNENFGTIVAGESEILCLEESHAYQSEPDFLMLFIHASYEGEKVYDGYFCGTGLFPIVSGEFELDVTIYEFG